MSTEIIVINIPLHRSLIEEYVVDWRQHWQMQARRKICIETILIDLPVVNCISPGGLYVNQDERFVKQYNKKVPLGRMATGDDIKGVIVFLASPASVYITGENLVVDGGLCMQRLYL